MQVVIIIIIIIQIYFFVSAQVYSHSIQYLFNVLFQLQKIHYFFRKAYSTKIEVRQYTKWKYKGESSSNSKNSFGDIRSWVEKVFFFLSSQLIFIHSFFHLTWNILYLTVEKFTTTATNFTYKYFSKCFLYTNFHHKSVQILWKYNKLSLFLETTHTTNHNLLFIVVVVVVVAAAAFKLLII